VKEDSWTLRSSTSAAAARNTDQRHILEARSKAISEYESLHFNIRHFRDETVTSLKIAVETADARSCSSTETARSTPPQ